MKSSHASLKIHKAIFVEDGYFISSMSIICTTTHTYMYHNYVLHRISMKAIINFKNLLESINLKIISHFAQKS